MTDLPNELLEQIFCSLGKSDLKDVRLACSVFNSVAVPFLFENLLVDFNAPERRQSARLDFIREIAYGKRDLGRHVRYVKISPPLPVAIPLKDTESTKNHRILSFLRKKSDKPDTVTLLDPLTDTLTAAVSKISAVRIVRWHGSYPVQCPSGATLATLLNHPYVQQLDLSGYTPPLSTTQLRPLPNLTHILYAGNHPAPTLASVLSNTPNLQGLSIVNMGETTVTTLNDLFTQETTYPLLSRLHLVNITWAPQSVSLIRCVPSLREFQHDGPMPDRVWRMLYRENIALNSISLTNVQMSDALLDYLSPTTRRAAPQLRVSFYLHEVDLDPVNGSSTSERQSRRFWDVIVPSHHLTSIQVGSDYPSGWCLDIRSLRVLRACSFLQEMRLRVAWNDIEGDNSIVSQLFEVLPYDIWPELEVVSLDPVEKLGPIPGSEEYQGTSDPRSPRQARVLLQACISSLRFDAMEGASMTRLFKVAIYAAGKGPYTLQECSDSGGCTFWFNC
nr:Lac1 [Flammulina velutipes]